MAGGIDLGRPIRAAVAIAAGFLVYRVTTLTVPAAPVAPANRSGLDIQESSGRIVLRWSGQVDPAMVTTLEDALARYRYDERPLQLVLNSAGGQVSAGRELLDLIDWMKRQRRLETHVAKGNICASMCVPVYLAGSRRTAAPGARFMFHEARIAKGSAQYAEVRKQMEARLSRAEIDALERGALAKTTDLLFGSDMSYWDVNEAWLRRMRQAVRGGKDVWLTAAQLVEQGSGIVHALE